MTIQEIDSIRRLLFLLLAGLGVILVVIYANWLVAVGIFLMFLGHKNLDPHHEG